MMKETMNIIPEAPRTPVAALSIALYEKLREQHAEIVRLREEVHALRSEIWELRSDLEDVNNR
jgi:cell division protein FtsB